MGLKLPWRITASQMKASTSVASVEINSPPLYFEVWQNPDSKYYARVNHKFLSESRDTQLEAQVYAEESALQWLKKLLKDLDAETLSVPWMFIELQMPEDSCSLGDCLNFRGDELQYLELHRDGSLHRKPGCKWPLMVIPFDLKAEINWTGCREMFEEYRKKR